MGELIWPKHSVHIYEILKKFLKDGNARVIMSPGTTITIVRGFCGDVSNYILTSLHFVLESEIVEKAL